MTRHSMLVLVSVWAIVSYATAAVINADNRPAIAGMQHPSAALDESAQIHDEAGSASAVSYTDVQGGWSGVGGIGNIIGDPQFVDPDRPDGTSGTKNDDLRLSSDSPYIDAGDNTAVPSDIDDLDDDGGTAEPIPFDLDGNQRILNGTVDMGAFEAQVPCEAVEVAKLTASDFEPGDHFGASVAISGNVAVIGSVDDGDNGTNSGSAYVFRFDGASWMEEEKLVPSDGAAGDSFGIHVAISGNTIVVAAHLDGDNGPHSGSAYVFRFDGANWIQEAKLVPSDGVAKDQFGVDVSIDGETILVGAPAIGNNAAAGSAYIFVAPPGGWGSVPSPLDETAKLTASDSAPDDEFGASAAISGDIAIIAAGQDDDNGNNSGSIYIFTRPPTGWENMNESAKLKPSDGAAGDRFGRNDVAISGDTIVAGAFFDDDNGNRSGSAYVFRYDGSAWMEEAKLLPSDGAAEDWFAYSTGISGDIAVVGAINDDDAGSRSGSVYVFKKPAGGWVSMSETGKLTAADGAAGDQLGGSVGISSGTVLAGASEDDDNGSNSGSAYVFDISECIEEQCGDGNLDPGEECDDGNTAPGDCCSSTCEMEPAGSQTCGVGACEVTTDACAIGVPVVCTPGTPTAEVCDGLDNDCDGITDEGFIEIHAAKHTVGSGSNPGSTKAPLVGIEICAYDKSDGSCARVICGGISHQHYQCIVDDCGEDDGEEIFCCTTDSNGECTINAPPGDYIVISDDASKTVLPDPLGVSASDLVCGEVKQKHLQQIIKAGGE